MDWQKAKWVMLCFVCFFVLFLCFCFYSSSLHTWTFRRKDIHFIWVQKGHPSHEFGGTSPGKGQVTTPKYDDLQGMDFFFLFSLNLRSHLGRECVLISIKILVPEVLMTCSVSIITEIQRKKCSVAWWMCCQNLLV